MASHEIAPDAAQEVAAEAFDRLAEGLFAYRPDKKRWFGLKRPPTPPRGLYLHGGVGRGKSMLMDLFFETVTTLPKRRVHFHEFMAETHDRIFAWRSRERVTDSGNDDPIPPVAQQVAAEATLLCFDEFQVHDIADASILGRLFTALLELGVVVVATSNRDPDALYKNGLHRDRFLPFIALLKQRMEVLSLDGETDYRNAALRGHRVFHHPLDAAGDRFLRETFAELTNGAKAAPCTLRHKGREIRVPAEANGVARFTFADLCEAPLGAGDYLRIARAFHTILLADIPRLGAEKRNEARRFVHLIDALYEARVKLVATAEVTPTKIYPIGDGAFEFERTASRLAEMQSAGYLEQPHLVGFGQAARR